MTTERNPRRWLLSRASALAAAACLAPWSLSSARDHDDDGFRIGSKPGRGWRLLGEGRASRSVDRDVIRVGGDQAYTTLRLRVFDAPIEFLKVSVHFRNGGSRDIEVRQFIERGGSTRRIDLPGNRRLIDRVVFWYRTPSGTANRARVQLWGRA